jgi:hypothetical protein
MKKNLCLYCGKPGY